MATSASCHDFGLFVQTRVALVTSIATISLAFLAPELVKAAIEGGDCRVASASLACAMQHRRL